jgi:hypothetical protein
VPSRRHRPRLGFAVPLREQLPVAKHVRNVSVENGGGADTRKTQKQKFLFYAYLFVRRYAIRG